MTDDTFQPNWGRPMHRPANALPGEAEVETLTVTRVEYSWGSGTDDNMVRRVVELHDDQGAFLRWDPGYPENTTVVRVPRSRP